MGVSLLMKYLNIFLFGIFILLLGVGVVSASDDISLYNGTGVLPVDDGDAVGLVASVGTDSVGTDSVSAGSVSADDVGAEGLVSRDAGRLGDSVSADDLDDDIFADFSFDFGDVSSVGVAGDGVYEIVTGNVSLYGLGDVYKVKVVDGSGSPVLWGYVDFFVGHSLVASCPVGFGGLASFDLASCVNASGSYDVVSVYHWYDGSDVVLAHQCIGVGNGGVHYLNLALILGLF